MQDEIGLVRVVASGGDYRVVAHGLWVPWPEQGQLVRKRRF